MDEIVQPSILTVCVPRAGTDAGMLELQELFAARERAALNVGRSDLSGSGESSGVHSSFASSHTATSHTASSNASCDACDDSACGMDVLGEASAGCPGPLCGLGAAESNRMSICEKSPAYCHDGLCKDRDAETLSGMVCRPSFFHADSGKKALELMRMLRFDLLVTGDRLPDMPVSQLVRRVRVAWPWQKWAMVGSMISTQDEITARSLGAMAVLDAPPDWNLLGSLAAAAAGGPPAVASATGGSHRNSQTLGTSRRICLDDEATAGGSASVERRAGSGSRSNGKRVSSNVAAMVSRKRSDRSVG